MIRPNLNQRAYIALHLRSWYLGPRIDENRPLVNELMIVRSGLNVHSYPTEEMVDAYDLVLDWVDDPPRVV